MDMKMKMEEIMKTEISTKMRYAMKGCLNSISMTIMPYSKI